MGTEGKTAAKLFCYARIDRFNSGIAGLIIRILAMRLGKAHHQYHDGTTRLTNSSLTDLMANLDAPTPSKKVEEAVLMTGLGAVTLLLKSELV